jgi:hypothetical protein
MARLHARQVAVAGSILHRLDAEMLQYAPRNRRADKIAVMSPENIAYDPAELDVIGGNQ